MFSRSLFHSLTRILSSFLSLSLSLFVTPSHTHDLATTHTHVARIEAELLDIRALLWEDVERQREGQERGKGGVGRLERLLGLDDQVCVCVCVGVSV